VLVAFHPLLGQAGLGQRESSIQRDPEFTGRDQIHGLGKPAQRAHRRAENRKVLGEHVAVINLETLPAGVANGQDAPTLARGEQFIEVVVIRWR